MVKNPPASAVDARDMGSIPGEGRCPEGGNDNPLQYSCLEIPWTEEPDRLEFIGLQRAGHNLATKQQKQLGNKTVQSSSVQSLSRVRLFVTPWTVARQTSLSITNSWSLLKLMTIESVMPSNHFILCHPLFFQPSIVPSIRVLK